MKMKKSHLILVPSSTGFLKKFIPLRKFLETLSSPLKKGVGGDRKLMCFRLKIYVILFNSFCVFLSEHIDAFWMFLLLPAIKNKTIIQNKTEDRQSGRSSSWARLTNPWKLFKPNKPTRQLSFWEFRFWGGLQLLIIDLSYTSLTLINNKCNRVKGRCWK